MNFAQSSDVKNDMPPSQIVVRSSLAKQHDMGVSSNGGTPKTPQNDHFY